MITVIGNLKGGTGKSTVTFNLAVWLCLAEIEVKVIDLDPQQTLTDVAALRLEERFEPPVYVKSGVLPDEELLREAEETLIDVGNSDIEAFKQALSIADRVLIPVTPSQADIWSTQRFLQIVHTISQGELPELVALINRADTHREILETEETAAALISLPGVRLLRQRLCERTVFRSSFSEGLAVFELEPWGRGSQEFKTLAASIFNQKHATIDGYIRKEHTPDRFDSVTRHDTEESLVDPTVTEAGEFKEEEIEADIVKTQGGARGFEGEKKKNKAKENRKGKKGKTGKRGGKGKKGKKAEKGKIGKKDKREKKAKEGGKMKKARKRKDVRKGKKAKKGKKVKKG